jgi:hypothetical protein
MAGSTTAKMEELIAKYSTFDPHVPVLNVKEKDGQYLVSEIICSYQVNSFPRTDSYDD